MYGVTVEDIQKWNNHTDNSLSIGQEIVVKKPKAGTPTPVSTPVAATTSSAQKTKAGQTHTVEVQETLYGIARKYDVSVQELMKWNELASQDLKVGQVIVVGPPDGKTSAVASTPVQATPPVSKNTTPDPVKATPAEERSVTETPKTEPVASQPKTQTPPQTIRISESVKSSDEVMEAGLAELIEGTEGNRKYLALHRTAPVGTILKVRNELNNREVFVRVMGKLQDTAPNSKLILKLSRSAYDRLGAIDPRFRVEVTYYK
jgi:LysM repeat protein